MSLREKPYPVVPCKTRYHRDFWAERSLTTDEFATFCNRMQDYGDDLIESIIRGDLK